VANAKDRDPYSFEKFMISAIATVVAIIVLAIGSCCAHVDYRIGQAIKAGNDPVLARAAFSNSDGSYERAIHVAKEKR